METCSSYLRFKGQYVAEAIKGEIMSKNSCHIDQVNIILKLGLIIHNCNDSACDEHEGNERSV